VEAPFYYLVKAMLLQQKQLRDEAAALVKQFLVAAQVNGRVAAMCRYRHKVCWHSAS
jgi:hypothetical protein